MRIVSSVISVHSSDTAGVNSALYELGGMCVVHDASGCNSTYATHDEPRWYHLPGRTYISALTENDVIMGNDERFIDNVVKSAANFPQCRFIAICGSPLPAMVGTDFDALGREIEIRTHIPVLALHTNGMRSYLAGANEALIAFAERFCDDNVKKCSRRVNLLGATPLDFSVNGSVGSICRWLEEKNFAVNSVWSMNSSFEKLVQAGNAEVNLVISSAALKLAEYMEKRFQIPFVAGVPVGKGFSDHCAEALKKVCQSGISQKTAVDLRTPGKKACVIGETLWSSSLACALEMDLKLDSRVLDPLEEEFAFTREGDLHVPDENAVERAFAESEIIFADPLYKPVAPAGCRFCAIPHEAFSGRCFRKNMKDLCCKNLEKEFNIC